MFTRQVAPPSDVLHVPLLSGLGRKDVNQARVAIAQGFGINYAGLQAVDWASKARGPAAHAARLLADCMQAPNHAESKVSAPLEAYMHNCRTIPMLGKEAKPPPAMPPSTVMLAPSISADRVVQQF